MQKGNHGPCNSTPPQLPQLNPMQLNPTAVTFQPPTEAIVRRTGDGAQVLIEGVPMHRSDRHRVLHHPLPPPRVKASRDGLEGMSPPDPVQLKTVTVEPHP
ncbi:UNVERIFIED_CONTAM: hypothetical protein FKN15_055244 [Acipenser sinensis]